MAITNVVGSSPISFTDSTGAQQFVPLSALQFNGSTIELKDSWSTYFDATDTTTIVELAKARAAAKEIVPPQVAPRVPALVFTAVHPGSESNNIRATSTVGAGSALTAPVKIDATEADTYTGLATAAAAALALGVDAPSGKPGDPVAGTGLVVVKASSVSNSNSLPDATNGPITSAGYAVKSGSDTLFTLVPRAGYADNGALKIDVAVDASGTTFTITATYDSTLVAGQSTVTLLTLSTLPAPVAYLVSASAQPGGAALPQSGSVHLAGGGPGTAASGVIYTS